MKKLVVIASIMLSACSLLYKNGQGQHIFHWAKESTGIEQFARDHSECLRKAESWTVLPNIKNWFYSEEAKYNIIVDWHSKKGIWASYIPYAGAQPIMVNSLRNDEDMSPIEYEMCMETRGYWQRAYNIPETTNIFVYKPVRTLQKTIIDSSEDF